MIASNDSLDPQKKFETTLERIENLRSSYLGNGKTYRIFQIFQEKEEKHQRQQDNWLLP